LRVFRLLHISCSLLLSAVVANAAEMSGRVSSAREGAMEGVLVSAQLQGSPITITVVSDTDGRFSFPAKCVCARPAISPRSLRTPNGS
jgi:hypothetical protein